MKRKYEEPEKKGYVVDEELLKKIFDLIYRGRVQEAKQLIPKEYRHLPLALVDPPGTRYWGDVPLLHYAAMYGHYDIIDYLLDGGANIDLRQLKYEYTPLYAAASRGRDKCCELLIARGANINSRSKWGKTPLSIALYNNHESTGKMLIRRGADINTREYDGWTPLHNAVYWHHASVVKLLLLGVRVDIKDRTGRKGGTLLDLAKLDKNDEILSLLENHMITEALSGVISRGLVKESPFSDFLVFDKICDARLFLIVAKFAYQ